MRFFSRLHCAALLALVIPASAWLPAPGSYPSIENGHGLISNPALLDPFDGSGYLLGFSVDNKEHQAFTAGAHGDQMGLVFQWNRLDSAGLVVDDSRWSFLQSEYLGGGFSSGFRLSYLRTNLSDPIWSLDPGLVWRPTYWISLGWNGENLWSTPNERAGYHRFGATLRSSFGSALSWSSQMEAHGGPLRKNYAMLQEFFGCCIEAGIQVPFDSKTASWDEASVSARLVLSPHGGISFWWNGEGGASQVLADGQTHWSSRAPGARSLVRLPLVSTGEGYRGLILFGSSPEPLFSLRNQFVHLAQDQRVETVLLDFTGFNGDFAAASEIRRWTQFLRWSHRRTIAYLDNADPVAYYAASASDRIVLQPSGMVDIRGFSAGVLYWKGLLDTIGIKPDMARVGKYKSAVEPWTADSMSEEARSDLLQLLTDRWLAWRDSVAHARGISADSLEAYAQHPRATASAARERRLVDTTLYIDQVADWAGYPSMAEWPRQDDPPYSESWKRGPRIAVLFAEGTVTSGPGGVDRMSGIPSIGAVLGNQLDELRNQGGFDAVVLRISSPGGDAGASEALWRKVVALRESGTPVVVSIGDMAASGGYYLAVAGDRIIAEPNSIVGSVGIFGGKMVADELARKLRIRPEVVQTHPHADALGPHRHWDEEERATVEESMQDFYHRFADRVASSRGIDSAAMDTLGGGRVYTGSRALHYGLVDELGGVDAAIRTAAMLSGARADRVASLTVFPLGNDEEIPSLGLRSQSLSGRLLPYLPMLSFP